MRKYLYAAVASLLLLQGCSEYRPRTVEENILYNSFSGYYAALAFDEGCNKIDFKDRSADPSGRNLLLLLNEKLVVVRLAQAMQQSYPGETPEALMDKISIIRDGILQKYKDEFAKNGCSSEAADYAEKSLALFSEMRPNELSGMMDKEIIKQGGTVSKAEDLAPLLEGKE